MWSRILYTVLAIVFSVLIAANESSAAETEAGGDTSNDSFTTVTTHVEVNSLGQFFKIEFRPSESTRPPRTEEEEASKETKSLFVNWFGIVSVDKRGMETGCLPRFTRVGILRIPFFSFFSLNEKDQLNTNYPRYMSWNLFALFDGVVEKTKEKNDLGGNSRFARVVFLDSIPFTVFRIAFEAPQRQEWEALDLPLSTTLWHMTDKNENRWRVLNIPFLWIYRYDRHGDSTRTHFVDGPGVGIYHRSRKGDERDDWSLFDALVIDGARGRKRGDESHFGVLETFKLFHGSFVSVYNSDVEIDKRGEKPQTVSSNQIVRLPLIGPLVGLWRDDKGGHFAVLPNLFIKSKNRPEAFRYF